MAEVWLAVDEHLPRQVAVKLLKPQLAGDAIAVERFRREAAMVARLAHPNIVTIHDFGTVRAGGLQPPSTASSTPTSRAVLVMPSAS